MCNIEKAKLHNEIYLVFVASICCDYVKPKSLNFVFKKNCQFRSNHLLMCVYD